ncbi:hypothetical protein D3C76_1205090 [compost metagenome]
MARFGTAHAEDIQHHAPDVAAHLHRRPFAAQHHTRAQGAHTADKFYRDHPPPAHRTQLLQCPFDLRYARSPSLRSKATYQVISQHRQRGGKNKGQRPNQDPIIGDLRQRGKALLLHPIYRLIKGHPEQPRQGAHQRRHKQDRHRRFIPT